MKDYWIDHYSSPKADDSQDWTLTHSHNNSTHLVFEFKRPLKTCDSKEDLEFSSRYTTQNLIWAYGDTVPESTINIGKHSRMGVQHINLFDPFVMEEPEEDDIELTEITFENVSSS